MLLLHQHQARRTCKGCLESGRIVLWQYGRRKHCRHLLVAQHCCRMYCCPRGQMIEERRGRSSRDKVEKDETLLQRDVDLQGEEWVCWMSSVSIGYYVGMTISGQCHGRGATNIMLLTWMWDAGCGHRSYSPWRFFTNRSWRETRTARVFKLNKYF